MVRKALAQLALIAAVLITAVVVVIVRSGGSSDSSASPRGAVTQAPSSPSSAPTALASPTSPVTTAPSSPPVTQSPSSSSPVSVRGGHAKRTGAKAKREPAKAKREAAKGPITYTVKPGDNLWSIARWFHLHGYGALYDWNKKVVGSNPALIFPGQKITVSQAGNATSK